ncbi:alpha/beta hydrolase fold protein [Halothece sp. PCC 7418]|uniref:alpha/beta fold hydrolase n=1 Tax=Halothece sp. (strain PCC 7418) TaxID=65093 RepID=UPI0002A06724|nr:alpha/beta hydrolase [Halothece sp. PCC 7418]AFZ43643.1 alpha/beta hydrolase fold protein [Halothece sp. PCC 7418]
MTSRKLSPFIPSLAEKLTEDTSSNLVANIQQIALDTDLAYHPIQTTYVRQGEGELPLLFLHGFDSSLMEFRRILLQVSPTTETWAVDFFGFGLTDRPQEIAVTPEAIKSHLYAFWKQVIQRPMVLSGASMGGAVAIDFALTYPETVEQLILLDSAGFAGGPAMGKLMIPPLDRLATGFLSNTTVRQKISENAYYDRSFASEDALTCSMLHLAHPNWSRALISFTKSGGYNFLSNRIKEIRQPTLIIWGEQDKILGTKDAKRFEETIENSQLVWIPESGHVPHLEKPELTGEAIRNFLVSL